MARLSQLSRSIEGKVAIVTGAGSGMGRATAHLLADEGAQVALIDVNEAGLLAVQDELSQAGYVSRAWVLDLLDREAIQTVVAGSPSQHLRSRLLKTYFLSSRPRTFRSFAERAVSLLVGRNPSWQASS